MFDLGYAGIGTGLPGLKPSVPNRKKRKQGLSLEEKEYNQNHSKKRIVIEHTICRLKKYRIMGDIFRNSLKKYDKVSYLV